MTKVLKSRLFLVVLCSLLALVFLFLYSHSVRSEAEKITAIRVTANVAKGDVITEDELEAVTVGGYNLDKSVMTSKGDVVGKYAATDLVKGGLVMKANLSDNILSASNQLEQLDGSRVALSVTIKDFSDGVSDKLMTGDIVSLFVNKDKQVTEPPELTYVEVLAATTDKGVDREDREDTDNLKTITLLVTPKQAQLLAGYEDDAEIHFALIYRGDHDTAQRFLDKQNEVLANG